MRRWLLVGMLALAGCTVSAGPTPVHDPTLTRPVVLRVPPKPGLCDMAGKNSRCLMLLERDWDAAGGRAAECEIAK